MDEPQGTQTEAGPGEAAADRVDPVVAAASEALAFTDSWSLGPAGAEAWPSGDGAPSFTGRRRRHSGSTSRLLERIRARQSEQGGADAAQDRMPNLAAAQPELPPSAAPPSRVTPRVELPAKAPGGSWEDVFKSVPLGGPLIDADLAGAAVDPRSQPSLTRGRRVAPKAKPSVLPRVRLGVLAAMIALCFYLRTPAHPPTPLPLSEAVGPGVGYAHIDVRARAGVGASWAVRWQDTAVVQVRGWDELGEEERAEALRDLWWLCGEPMRLSVVGPSSTLLARVWGGSFELLPPDRAFSREQG